MNPQLSNFWNLPADQVLVKVQSTPQGLSSEDAKQRLTQYGANSLKQKQQSHTLMLLLNQFNSPIILILIFAAILSSFLKDTIDIVSGNATAVVVNTGKATEFGKVSERLKFRPPETEFESGVHKFGYFLLEVTLTLVILIFAANIYLQRPVLDSFMFSLALAVGLIPQLLPAIISINLAHGAKLMAKKQVIVKRLPAIENFGSMNVLCADKTGTLTDGVMRIRSALNLDEKESDRILFYAYLNAISESGYVNPIDEAIGNHKSLRVGLWNRSFLHL